MKRHYVAAVVLLVGVLALGAGLAPSVGCDRTYALDATAVSSGETSDQTSADGSVVNASALPADVRGAVNRTVAGERATVTRAAYKTHLEDRNVRFEGTTYETDLVVVEACGGLLEDVLFVAGAAATTLGALAVVLLWLYRDDLGPPLTVLHYAAAAALVVGAVVFTGGVAAPAGCTDNYALETRELVGENATDERVVDASSLPSALADVAERAVESNQTAFVDRAAYREHLENRSLRYDGTVYDADLVLVQDCGGGLDDALLVVGLVVGTIGAVALALLVTFDHGEKVL
ncbi:hypothetical protein G9C85_02305 [Halorubellus sp. JP-L1]|uniref:hypothetical protein n=1 Tax=Halorubellus sp. JP-L1 TaxID=2715753 RepID=UPI00140DDA2D|nr:hypothetical protein [Halorubellus sp. JP-L1]NHN40469.1 hypothetical protein [Halorubellus sp. JP-L1]